jgi:hypothetical protein
MEEISSMITSSSLAIFFCPILYGFCFLIIVIAAAPQRTAFVLLVIAAAAAQRIMSGLKSVLHS